MNTGIRDFIEEIKAGLDGKRVEIKIIHSLYGNQQIECNMELIDDESRLGFRINGQDIYIDRKEISDFGMTKGVYHFASKLIHIELKTI